MKYLLTTSLLVSLIAIGIPILGILGSQNNVEEKMMIISNSTGQNSTPLPANIISGQGDYNYTLSQQEINNILFLREEEKLARDIYLTFYKMYGLPMFLNIAKSEQNHMNAVRTLIEKYNLTDPVIDEIGVFTNDTLQELYNQLVEQGSQSLVDALLVGALIEEKDIIDINNLINSTENPDILRVFTRLVEGSTHHLIAFTSKYEEITGKKYQPQLLTLEQYNNLTSNTAKKPMDQHEQGKNRVRAHSAR